LLRSFAGIRAAAHAKPAEARISTHERKLIVDYFRYNVVSADALIQRRFHPARQSAVPQQPACAGAGIARQDPG